MLLKLMQWNVQDLFLQLAYPLSPGDLDGLTEQQWQLVGAADVALKPLDRTRGLAQAILDEAPDVVMLNEVGGPESLAAFARLFLGEAYTPLLVPGRAQRGIGNGFLLRRGLPLSATSGSHRNVPAPFLYPHEADPAGHAITPEVAAALGLGRPEERTLSRDVADLRLYAGEVPVLALLLAHLKSAYDPDRIDPEGATRRAAEVRGLLGVHAAVQKELPGVPVIVAGDMNSNASRRGTAREFLPLYETTDLLDVMELAGLPWHERITHLSFFLDHISARQLDYVFLPAPLHQRLVRAQTYVHRFRFSEDASEMGLPLSLRERRLLPSDHYPVVCVLDLGADEVSERSRALAELAC